ncbi:DUF6168 family protein [Flagellimonas sp. 2504JD4-2]
MPKLNFPAKFVALLVTLLLISFGLHILVLSNMELPTLDNLIVRSYVVNGLLAVIIFILLYKFRQKLKNQIGFLFMGGSLLKFVFFFLLFYPTYKSDGDMSGLEFGAFFVPYLVALFLETFYTSKMLKNLEDDSK